MSGKLVVGLNPHGEITSLVFPGRVSLQKEDIMNCIRNAFSKAKASAEMVQKAVEEDLEKRKSLVKPEGFTNSLTSDAIYTRKRITKDIQSMHKMEFKIPQESLENHEKYMSEVNIEGVTLDSDEETAPTPFRQMNQCVTETDIKQSMEAESDSEEEMTEKLTSQDLR